MTMDGIHDLGGKHGFGAVNFAPDSLPGAPVFHARWEAAVFAATAALLAATRSNTDEFRHAVERIDPVAYLTHGYYGRWLGGIETLAVETGTLTAAEISARAIAHGARANDLIAARPAAARTLATASRRGAQRALTVPPRFDIGQAVRTRADVLPGHTRLPAYARDRVGTVLARHGGWVFPDSNAMGRGEHPQHLYTVAFTGDVLWGAGAESDVTVRLDLYEPYLTLEVP